MMRSRCQQYEEGERNSKYFYNLEKTNGKKKSIHKLIENNNVIYGNTNILKEEVSYFTDLYSSKKCWYDKQTRDCMFDKFLFGDHPTLKEESLFLFISALATPDFV